jgi:multidrug resistance efflux pump
MAVDLNEALRADRPPDQLPRPRRARPYWVWGAGVAAFVVAAGVVRGVPRVQEYWGSSAGGDAFVTGYVTHVSARIPDVVEHVYVKVNDYVDEGTLLATLDRAPFVAAVARKRAALVLARAALHRDRQPAADEQLVSDAPAAGAAAKVRKAERELAAAVVCLSYTEIRAPVAGFISARRVHAGSTVEPGQELLAIRPLSDVWIEIEPPRRQERQGVFLGALGVLAVHLTSLAALRSAAEGCRSR